MLPRYRLSPTSSCLTVTALAMSIALSATSAFSEDVPVINQPMFGTVKTDGWALEIHNPATDGSIFVPFNSTIEGQMQAIIERIAEAEKTPINFYTLQPNMEVYLYDSENANRLESYELGSSAIPLSPCLWGYCLPPWLLDTAVRPESPGFGITDPSVPVVNSEDIMRYLRPMD
jgi:hypothetical protein